VWMDPTRAPVMRPVGMAGSSMLIKGQMRLCH
jgi:hypothetical protein